MVVFWQNFRKKIEFESLSDVVRSQQIGNRMKYLI